jgi:hypothetical protein
MSDLTIVRASHVLSAYEIRPYKSYVALLTQTSTNAPVATVLENTLGAVPVWSRNTQGVYYATSANLFTVGKTTVSVGQNLTVNGDFGVVNVAQDVNKITLFVYDVDMSAPASSSPDDMLSNTAIEIRIYL